MKNSFDLCGKLIKHTPVSGVQCCKFRCCTFTSFRLFYYANHYPVFPMSTASKSHVIPLKQETNFGQYQQSTIKQWPNRDYNHVLSGAMFEYASSFENNCLYTYTLGFFFGLSGLLVFGQGDFICLHIYNGKWKREHFVFYQNAKSICLKGWTLNG